MNSLVSAKLCLQAGMMNSYQNVLQEQMQQVNTCSVLPKELEAIKPVLQFLHHIWWRIEIEGLERLPENGPVFIAANTNSIVPWPALMFLYALAQKGKQRRVNVLANMEGIDDERIFLWLYSLNFRSWSHDNAKKLLEEGEILLVFPEQITNQGGASHMENRVSRFDWTKFLPAIESNVPIYPLATLGLDDLRLPGLPTLIPPPAPCQMHLINAVSYNHVAERELVQQEAKKVSLFSEGEIQAEINRQLRARSRKQH
jgi:1-acyl-sn-glycerol-3-phosphate acyltransferase